MIPLLPLKLEHAIREVAAQFERRRRLQGRLIFGAVFLGLLIGLCAVVAFVDRVPVIVPVLTFLVLVFGAGYKWLYVPQRTVVAREQIALFLDAHHPDLEDLIVSSVSLHGATPVSEWMTDQVFQQVRELSAIQAPPVIDLRVLKRVRRAVVGVWGLGAVVLLVALWQVNLGDIAGRLFFAPTLPLPYTVEPGDTRVRRGAHQMVWVTTDLASASKAMQWRTSGGDWQTAPLEPGEAGNVFAHQLRDLYANTEYQVQVGSYRSKVYRLSVWTPPEVVSIGLLYRYPDYLEMEDREVPYGGDITAPEGTEVVVLVTVNKALEKAALILDGGEDMALKKTDDAVWEGTLSIIESGTYEVELRDADGEENEYARAYKITAKVDQPPRIQVRFPRGDDEATAIEEVAFGFSIKDDYMLVDYGLQYEVAGRDPVRISLNTETARIESAEGEYPMALEDLGLAAGDFITWTVWAEDGKPGRSEVENLGDPYFLEIRPFERLYRQAVSNEGGQQGQGSGQRGGAEDQKQVIIAIWNLRKGASGMDREEYDEQKYAIIEAQETVQGSVRNPAADLEAEFAGVIGALSEASFDDPDAALARALGHAQRAYRYLLQRKPREAEVVQNRQRQRGGGGQAQQRELDGLELAQRRDFREEASTLQQQLTETAAAQNKIEELTRRQAAINEDVAQLISEVEKLDGEAREEAERRLEQLREAQRQTMDALDAVNGEIASGDMDPQQARRAREQLEGARQQMSRSAQNLENDQLQRARAAGNRALDALRDVQEQLGNLSRGAAAERMKMLQDQMDSLRAQQQGLVAQAQEQQAQRGTLSDSERALREMLEGKQHTADEFRDMMEEASALAEKAAESQGLMSQKLNDWLRETSREGIFEDMQGGERLVRLGAWQASETHERGVAEKLDQAAEKLGGVAQLLVRDDLEALERAQERLETVMGGGSEGRDGRFGWGPQDPDALRRFAEGGFRDWMDRLREAESLLPADLGVRQRLTGIREDLAGIGRDYYRKGAVPQYDLIFERAIKPLTLSAEELSELIRERKSDYGFSAGKTDEIPEQYRARVAEYFKALTESEK